MRLTECRFKALQITAVFAVCLVTLAAAASSANPPAKRTYLTTLMGGGESLGDLDFDCLKFNKNGTVCFEDDEADPLCGTWERIEPFVDNQSFITVDFNFTEEGDDFTVRGRLTVDSRGQKGKKMSSVGGTLLVVEEGEESRSFTLSLAGKQAKAKKCRQLRAGLQDLFPDDD